MLRRLPVLAAAALAAAAVTVSTAPSTAEAVSCQVPVHTPGWEAIFGYGRTLARASAIKTRATKLGFLHLVIEQVGCPRYAVVLRGLRDHAQGRELQAEAARAGLTIAVKCWPPRDTDPDWEAIFGTGLARGAATRLSARAARVGFVGLKRIQNPCTNRWTVELDGIPTLRQAREFRAEARHAGFAVTLRRYS